VQRSGRQSVQGEIPDPSQKGIVLDARLRFANGPHRITFLVAWRRLALGSVLNGFLSYFGTFNQTVRADRKMLDVAVVGCVADQHVSTIGALRQDQSQDLKGHVRLVRSVVCLNLKRDCSA